jgi:hypothetical protein
MMLLTKLLLDDKALLVLNGILDVLEIKLLSFTPASKEFILPPNPLFKPPTSGLFENPDDVGVFEFSKVLLNKVD